MRIQTTFATVAVLCAALCAPALAQQVSPPPPAAAAAAVDPVHLQAVSEMLTAMRVGDMTIAGMRLAPAKTPERREFAEYLLAHISGDDVVRQFAPVYARHVPLAEARELGALFRGPQAQRALAAQLDLFTPPGQARRMSDQEARAAVGAFDASADGARYAAVVKLGLAESNPVLVRWLAQYHERLIGAPLREIAAERAAWVASGMVKAPVPFFPAKVGISYIDGYASLVATAGNRNLYATWKLERDMAALNFGDVMQPDKLLVPANMAHARSIIDDSEKSLEAFLSESDATLAAFRAGLATIRLPGAQDPGSPLTQALEYHMGRSVKFAENQRAMVALMRQAIDYVDARKSTVKVANGGFLFATDAEAQAFNALIAALQREIATGKAIWSKTRADMDQAAKGLL